MDAKILKRYAELREHEKHCENCNTKGALGLGHLCKVHEALRLALALETPDGKVPKETI